MVCVGCASAFVQVPCGNVLMANRASPFLVPWTERGERERERYENKIKKGVYSPFLIFISLRVSESLPLCFFLTLSVSQYLSPESVPTRLPSHARPLHLLQAAAEA